MTERKRAELQYRIAKILEKTNMIQPDSDEENGIRNIRTAVATFRVHLSRDWQMLDYSLVDELLEACEKRVEEFYAH